MKKLSFTLICLVISYISLQNYCQGESFTYVGDSNGLLKCDENFKNCVTPFNDVSNTDATFINASYSNKLIYNNIMAILDTNGKVKTQYPLDHYISQGGGNRFHLLNNILYTGEYAYYLDYPLPNPTFGFNEAYLGVSSLLPLVAKNHSQYGYYLNQNELELAQLDVQSTSFCPGGSNPGGLLKPPFNCSSKLLESSAPIYQFNDPVTMVKADNYLYVADNYNLNICQINQTDYSVNCNPHSLRSTPVNLYYDPITTALDIVYNARIDRCSITQSNGSIGKCNTVYTGIGINSLGFYNSPESSTK